MSVKTSWLAIFCGLTLAVPALAQEEPAPKDTPPAETTPSATESKKPNKNLEDPALHRWGGFSVSLAGWAPKLLAADEEVATTYANGVGQPMYLSADPRAKAIVQAAYLIPGDRGAVLARYDAMNSQDALQSYTPSQFSFFESRAYPLAVGIFEDGFADGISANATRKTREFRLDYQHLAFDSKWAKGTWSAGYRELNHKRIVDITYLALVPNLPPIMPPVGTENDLERLTPMPDRVYQSSEFSGHGLGATLDVEFPLHPRVSIISGLSIGLVRGKSESVYASTTSYYYDSRDPYSPLTHDQLYAYLSNPWPETGPPPGPDDPPRLSGIAQAQIPVQLHATTPNDIAMSFDAYFGLQALVYRGLRVFGTLRDVSYVNVGSYVVPSGGTSNTTTKLDAGYEGYQIGLSYRF